MLYYLNGWRRAFDGDRRREDADARLLDGVRVYFDTEGWLHVDGCPDPGARRAIEEWAEGWYEGAREGLGKTGPGLGWSCPVSAVIGRFARPIKPGFVQLSCGGESVNLDEGQAARYGAMEAVYDPVACRYAAGTGYPRLDRVLDGLLWELSGPRGGPRSGAAAETSGTPLNPRGDFSPAWRIPTHAQNGTDRRPRPLGTAPISRCSWPR